VKDAAGDLRRAAITAALAIGADQNAVATSLANLLAKGEEISVAAAGLKQLGVATWSKANAAAAVMGIASWVKAMPVERRTATDVKEVLAVGEQLAGLLTGDAAAKAKAALAEATVRVITLKTVREKMIYDQTKLVVEAGKPFAIDLINEDLMPHNLLVVTPGSRQEIAELAQVMPIDKPDAQGRVFYPVSDKILGGTKLVNPGKHELLLLTAPTIEGNYEYVCTFPGHWMIMKGILVVTKNPELLKNVK
jgi:azurin